MTKVKDTPGCQNCPMLKVNFTYKDKDGKDVHWVHAEHNFVPPKIGPSLRLVVAEAAGAEEEIKGEPLVGGSGRTFDSLIRKAGIPRDSLTILNTINCRPPSNIYPTDGAARIYCTQQEGEEIVSHCYRAHVKPVLDSRPWTRIDALGDKALRVLTGKTDGISKWRGSPLPLKDGVKPVVVGTFHPSYLMRDMSMIPASISDLKKGTTLPPEFYNVKPTLEDAAAFRFSRVCFDIETNRFTNQITMVGLSGSPFHCIVLPFRGPYIDEIKRIFREAKEVIGHNIIGFDLPHLKEAGVEIGPECEVYDTMLMQHLIQPDFPHDLEFVSSIFTQKPAWKHLSSEDMPLYCARDTDVTFQIFVQLLPLLKSWNLLDLYKYTQIPMQKICTLIENTGMHTDVEHAKKVRNDKIAEITELEKLLPEELKPYDKPIRVRHPAPKGTLGKSGKPVKYIHVPGTKRIVPWNSPDAVGNYLYGTLQLPEQFNSKTKQVSTDKKALEKLYAKTKRPELAALKTIRRLDEIVSNFLKESNLKTGKVYPHLAVVGTAIGRLSCASPNMQNQPPEARYIYVPSDPAWVLVEADFSQGENRLTAWYADDKERLARLAQPGFSEHKWNANIFFGVPYNEVKKDNHPDAPYGMAKKLTHGMGYGEGPRKVAMDLGLPEKEVRDHFIKWRLANQPTVHWQEQVSHEAELKGFLTNAFDRKRWFWTSKAYTESLAFKPASTLADICFRAMIALMYERIGWPIEKVLRVSSVLAPLPFPARLLLQNHDALLVETPVEVLANVIKAMDAAMTQAWPQLGGSSVPVEFKTGKPGQSWGELE